MVNEQGKYTFQELCALFDLSFHACKNMALL